MALAPAYFLGLPLLAAGSTVLGSLTLAGAAGLAVMPFLGESAPRALRAIPGALLLGVGVAAASSGFVWPGAFAAVGGWGLMRYGLGRSRVPRYESLESLSAYFGGIAALLGMLNACASSVSVVNIDNGFGAASIAHRINVQTVTAYA